MFLAIVDKKIKVLLYQLCVEALQEDLAAIEQVAIIVKYRIAHVCLLLHFNLYLLLFHKVVTEISEDAASNGIKYFEISIDPYKFISKVIFLPPRPDKKADNVYSFSRTEASRECWMLYEVLQGLSIGGIIDAN